VMVIIIITGVKLKEKGKMTMKNEKRE